VKYLLLASLLSLSACASVAPNKLIEADESIIFNNKCKFKGSIKGHGSSFFMGRKSQIAGAKNEAIEQAMELKATHVIWEQLQLLSGGAYLTGRAYNCE